MFQFSLTDNETRVREVLVAPLLRRLGYQAEEIIEEFPLGLHNGNKVKADYLITREHSFKLPNNNLIVEVKRPSVSLSDPDVLDQARLYSSHRTVQASHIVLVNGFRLDVYTTNGPTPTLIQSFSIDELDSSWSQLEDLVGANALNSHFAELELIEHLGSGGYGQVFKARNSRLRRFEAIKVLHPSLENPASVLGRFQRGAQGMAALEHPHICRVYDANIYMGRPYYRMELIDGLSLTDYVNRKKPTLEARLQLFRHIAEALGYAHDNGVVHCDLKPANILVTADGTPKLIDFDFCHIGPSSSTTLSQVVATIAYMDPSIWQTTQNRDSLADVYSAGLLLWSIITGKELVPGWSPHSLITALDHSSAERDRLAHVVLSCIQENRAGRPSNMARLIHLLGIENWNSNLHSQVLGAVSSFSGTTSDHGFEFLFKLWQQTKSLPVATDFDRIAKNLMDRPLSDSEKEFVFRSACEHWSVKYRSVFKGWSTEELTRLSAIVLADPDINAAGRGKIAETSPARKALDILRVTDEYGSRADSENVARFILELLNGERLKNLFFTALDDLVRLKCFKGQNSNIRAEASRTLIRLIEVRLPNVDKGALRQIGKLLEKLERCANDTSEVVRFLQSLTNQPLLLDKATITLACFGSVDATDAFLSILEDLRGKEPFERTALKAIGVNGRYKRPAVVQYLSELQQSETLSPVLQAEVKKLLTV